MYFTACQRRLTPADGSLRLDKSSYFFASLPCIKSIKAYFVRIVKRFSIAFFVIIETGTGVTKDIDEAIRLNLLAAAIEHKISQNIRMGE